MTAVDDTETAQATEGDLTPETESEAPTRRRRRWLAVGAVLALGIAAVVFVAWRGVGNGADAAPTAATEAQAATTATAQVERDDLVVTEEFSGTLAYSDARSLEAGRSGVVTAVPEAGALINHGEALYSVDMEPVILLAGDMPAYRALDTDARGGDDVVQLQQALVDLGYADGLQVDGEFGAGTASAVQAWETALGRAEPDGEVELGDVLFMPDAVLVQSADVSVGAQVQLGTPVVTYTTDVKIVTVDLDAASTDLLPLDAVVEVTLPDDTTLSARVDRIGAEATSDTDGNTFVPVELAIDDQAAVAAFTTASVTVTVEEFRDSDVLVVPVTALLALAEGGYAVEVAGASGSELLPVEVGTVTDSRAAVTGEGITEGLEVVIAQ